MRIYYLVKSRALELQFRDGKTRLFAPSADIPDQYAANLLGKTVTVGGCCGKPSRTMHVFATEEQLSSGERPWIE